jgi:hypothetical protein
MSGNKAMKRALQKDPIRANGDVPLITDSTELITPEMAQEMLRRNKNNRPINWKKVEEYADIISKGEWRLHAQGIILDEDGNILTGQKRLWAIIYADTAVLMRISRGNPKSTAKLLDRGDPQSARDLASRASGRWHSPTESSIARACEALNGNMKPSKDRLAERMEENAARAEAALQATKGTKKTKPILMILAAICMEAETLAQVREWSKLSQQMAGRLETALAPHGVAKCWNKGVAFGLAMERAKEIVKKRGVIESFGDHK